MTAKEKTQLINRAVDYILNKEPLKKSELKKMLKDLFEGAHLSGYQEGYFDKQKEVRDTIQKFEDKKRNKAV